VCTDDGRFWLVWSKLATSTFPKGPEVLARVQTVVQRGSGDGLDGCVEVPALAQGGDEAGCIVQ